MALYFLSWADYSLWTRSTTDINLCTLLYLRVLRSWQGCLNIALRKVSAIEGSWRLTILSGKITYLQNSNCWSHECEISSARHLEIFPVCLWFQAKTRPEDDLWIVTSPSLLRLTALSLPLTWKKASWRPVFLRCTFFVSNPSQGGRCQCSGYRKILGVCW